MNKYKANFVGYEWDDKQYMKRIYEYRGYTYTVLYGGVYSSPYKQHQDSQGQIDGYHELSEKMKNNYTPGRTGQEDLSKFLSECDF